MTSIYKYEKFPTWFIFLIWLNSFIMSPEEVTDNKTILPS